MKTPADYLQQAAKNAELAAFLRQEKSEYLDWAVTCLFYSAIHLVNAYLSHRHLTIPRRHTTKGGLVGRSNIVQTDKVLGSIYFDYRALDDESRDARYELKKPTEEDYDKYLLARLNAIRAFILPKLK